MRLYYNRTPDDISTPESTAMPIRLLAKELYRLQQHVEKIQKELENAPLGQHERLQERLRSVRAERDYLRRLLDGQKDAPVRPRG